VMIFSADGRVSGFSTDYPYIKTFYPGHVTLSNIAG
jgi:hypothetical protein